MLGLSSNLIKSAYSRGLAYVRDGLKLYMPYRGANHSEVKFVGTGSTYFTTNDYIVIDALENDISSNTSGTIAFWMKPDDGQPSGTAGMVSLSDTSAEEYIYIQ